MSTLDPLQAELLKKINLQRSASKNRQFYFVALFKSAFIILLFLSSFKLYTGETKWIFMNNINLIFHKAGHIIFMFFGRFMNVLGGTLMEILVPVIIIIHFISKRNNYGISFGFWWLSLAFWSISIYAGDAQARILPLLGGGDSGHDWAYILGHLNILEYDYVVANLFLFLSLTALSFSACYFYNDLMINYKNSQSLK